MEYQKIKGVSYQVFTHKTMNGEKQTFISSDNKGRLVRGLVTGRIEKLRIAFEGLNYYHLGGTSIGNSAKCVNKKIFKLVN